MYLFLLIACLLNRQAGCGLSPVSGAWTISKFGRLKRLSKAIPCARLRCSGSASFGLLLYTPETAGCQYKALMFSVLRTGGCIYRGRAEKYLAKGRCGGVKAESATG